MFLFLAEAAQKTQEWIPIVVSALTALATAASSYFLGRKKQKSTDFSSLIEGRRNDFEAIMDERKEFTQEIRQELQRKQIEYEKEIAEYEAKFKALRDALTEKEAENLSLQAQIAELKNALVKNVVENVDKK